MDIYFVLSWSFRSWGYSGNMLPSEHKMLHHLAYTLMGAYSNHNNQYVELAGHELETVTNPRTVINNIVQWVALGPGPFCLLGPRPWAHLDPFCPGPGPVGRALPAKSNVEQRACVY